MLIIALFLAAYAAALGVRGLRDTLRSLPRSNRDWVWY
jgi:hypothetical protein